MTDVAVALIIAVCFLAQTWDHAGMPVVAVDDLRPVIQLIEHLEHGLLKIGETLTVIVIAIQ